MQGICHNTKNAFSLQCVAERCIVLQCVWRKEYVTKQRKPSLRGVLQCAAVYLAQRTCNDLSNTFSLRCAAVCCSVLQCVAVCCSVLQCVAVCCSVLQCVAVSLAQEICNDK